MYSGIAYIIIGLIVALVSRMHPTSADKFILFFYAGLLMASYGALRLLFVRKRKKRQPQQQHLPQPQHNPWQQQAYHHAHNQHHMQQQQYVNPKAYQQAHYAHHVHQQQQRFAQQNQQRR